MNRDESMAAVNEAALGVLRHEQMKLYCEPQTASTGAAYEITATAPSATFATTGKHDRAAIWIRFTQEPHVEPPHHRVNAQIELARAYYEGAEVPALVPPSDKLLQGVLTALCQAYKKGELRGADSLLEEYLERIIAQSNAGGSNQETIAERPLYQVPAIKIIFPEPSTVRLTVETDAAIGDGFGNNGELSPIGDEVAEIIRRLAGQQNVPIGDITSPEPHILQAMFANPDGWFAAAMLMMQAATESAPKLATANFTIIGPGGEKIDPAT